MNQTTEICSCCGAVLEREPSLVGIESGAPQAHQASANLCGKCTASLGYRATRDRRDSPVRLVRHARSEDPRLHPPPGSSLTRGQEDARVRNVIIFSIIFGTGMLMALIAFALLP